MKYIQYIYNNSGIESYDSMKARFERMKAMPIKTWASEYNTVDECIEALRRTHQVLVFEV